MSDNLTHGSSERKDRIECDGGPYCQASPHMHGCFADKGDCDDPSEHPAASIPPMPEGFTDRAAWEAIHWRFSDDGSLLHVGQDEV